MQAVALEEVKADEGVVVADEDVAAFEEEVALEDG